MGRNALEIPKGAGRNGIGGSITYTNGRTQMYAFWKLSTECGSSGLASRTGSHFGLLVSDYMLAIPTATRLIPIMRILSLTAGPKGHIRSGAAREHNIKPRA